MKSQQKTWECKVCNRQYTDLEKGYGTKCWQGHLLTEIDNDDDKERTLNNQTAGDTEGQEVV